MNSNTKYMLPHKEVSIIGHIRQILFLNRTTNKTVMYLFKLMTDLKHITVDPKVYEKLRNLGKTSDSFNDVLKKILFEQQQSPEGGINNINGK